MRKLLNLKYFIFFFLFACTASVWAGSFTSAQTEKTQIITQQIDLLKYRYSQEQSELSHLQKKQDILLASLTVDEVNKQLLSQAALEISIAKSDLDSINIEVSEAQLTIDRLQKDVQEIENQVNLYNIFGLKLVRGNVPDINELQSALKDQKQITRLEQTRLDYLIKLQKSADSILQLYNAKYARIEALLKSQTMLQLKEQQVKSEAGFEQQQNYWLQRLSALYAELNAINIHTDKKAYQKLQDDIFYANENVNFTYLQILNARYQEQLQQLKISISRSSSITLINKVMEQAQGLNKQLIRVHELLKTRMGILETRKTSLRHGKVQDRNFYTELVELHQQYRNETAAVSALLQEVAAFRGTLDQTLHQELSSRQGLPAIGTRGWLDLSAEILLIPTLTFQVFKSLSEHVVEGFLNNDAEWWGLLIGLEILWLASFYYFKRFLGRVVSKMVDHEFGHINLKWLSIKLVHRNLIDLMLIGNMFWLFHFFEIPIQNFAFLVNLSIVWILFKMLFSLAKIGLIESVHDKAGRDVRLYHRLKWTFFAGGTITAICVFIHQLPVIYEVKDLFDRIFLLYVFVVSLFLIKSWDLVPGLILPHVDARRPYLKKIILMMGLFIPALLLINSVLGLFGFVNLVQTISWYESIFLLVLAGYLIVRGFLVDALEFFSKILIKHVNNGWLWTEAFLKPIDKVLRVTLFLSSWAVLFLCYGWNQQSPIVMRLMKLLNYQLIDALNTNITPARIIVVAVILAFLYWAARWTREFVYRFLATKTSDLGIRNSLAILSQYTLILVGFLICLRVLGIDFRALTVIAGMFVFGVGLGLRDIANNFVCGFLLLIERPLRVGDVVTINGYEGDVIHIGGRAVTIRTWDHMEVLVPNAEIFSKTFTNWTARDSIVRTVISIKINRQDQPDRIQQIIYEVLKLNNYVLKDPTPEVYLKELNEGMIEFEIRYYINLRLVTSRTAIRSQVLIAIWNAFKEHGIEPPYPHHEIFLRSNPALT